MNSFSITNTNNLHPDYMEQVYNYNSNEMNPRLNSIQQQPPNYNMPNQPNASFTFSGYQVYDGVSMSNFSTPSSSNTSMNTSSSSDGMCNDYMKYLNSYYNYPNNFTPQTFNNSPLSSSNNHNIVIPSSISTPPSLDNSSSSEYSSYIDCNVNNQRNVRRIPRQYADNIPCTPVASGYKKKNQIQQEIESGVYEKCEKIPSYYEACQYVINHVDSNVIKFTMFMLMNPENASICHWTKYCWEFVITDPDSFVACFCETFDLDRNLITISHVSKVYKCIGSSNVYGQPIIERVKCRRNAFRLFPKHQNFTYPRLKDLGSNSLSTTFLKNEEDKALGKLRKIKVNVPIFSRKRKGSGKNEEYGSEEVARLTKKQRRIESYQSSL
uniref:Velvet domain-containing protein n=1 Tax=Strongyloides venezuelensis TaxID=75913 RepID=A0A0K0FR92_STRVS